MNVDAFSKFEWHDLPIERLSLTGSGFELVVTPHNEALSDFDRYRLTLSDASAIELEVSGTLSPRDWWDLEVSRLEVQAADDSRLSGTLGILPGSAGFWTVKFLNARWALKQLPGGGSEAAG